jgi:hypothetical protein
MPGGTSGLGRQPWVAGAPWTGRTEKQSGMLYTLVCLDTKQLDAMQSLKKRLGKRRCAEVAALALLQTVRGSIRGPRSCEPSG